MSAKYISVACVAMVLISSVYPSLANPWNEVPSLSCGDVVSAAGRLKPKAAQALTWFAGYLDGLKALGATDHRLKELANMDSNEIEAVFLVLCRNKQDETIAEAATGVLEMTLNALPGRRLDLVVPKH
jgi:ABC-type uncharacterized transport system fused permease/ATPase subunit